jgi:hypothetical protein
MSPTVGICVRSILRIVGRGQARLASRIRQTRLRIARATRCRLSVAVSFSTKAAGGNGDPSSPSGTCSGFQSSTDKDCGLPVPRRVECCLHRQQHIAAMQHQARKQHCVDSDDWLSKTGRWCNWSITGCMWRAHSCVQRPHSWGRVFDRPQRNRVHTIVNAARMSACATG